MKIIEQSYKIISLPNNLLQTIEAAGRTCYKSEDRIGCGADRDTKELNGCFDGTNDCKNISCEYHSSIKFVTHMRDRGHHAMIEFGDIIVRFITNRGVTHELVRHRLCSFAQESTRYVNYKGGMEFIRPVWWKQSTKRQQSIWLEAVNAAEMRYIKLLEEGWRPEQAREVLPNSLKTEIVTKANIREWRHIFQLRTSKRAHPQIRALFLPLLEELKEKIPIVFVDI